ncbi:hypothetical protein [Rhodococcus erythropolis]|nr:hypothetical protein [Rhodococcus erythropolis]OFV78602.1 hypothetical protein RERY_07340 [Rhodococcus erythropolis]
MTPPSPRASRRKRPHEWLGMASETAVILGCVMCAVAIVWWAA